MTGKDRVLSEYSFDYCFPGDGLGYKWTVLVGRERKSGLCMATIVPMKGSTGKFSVDEVLEFIRENGDQEADIIIITDQENAAKSLVDQIISERDEGKTIPEESPVGSSGSDA